MPAQVDKKKQILVYGRPGTERNAFNLVVAALKKWVMMQPDIEEWEILSAGEMHRSIPLGNGKELVSVGKLTIEEYAADFAGNLRRNFTDVFTTSKLSAT